jgi:hypothetical protein
MHQKLITSKEIALIQSLGNMNKSVILQLMLLLPLRTPKVKLARNIFCTVILSSCTWKSTSEFSPVPTLLDHSNLQVTMLKQIWLSEESRCSNSATLSRTPPPVLSTLPNSLLEVSAWNPQVSRALTSPSTKKKPTLNSYAKQLVTAWTNAPSHLSLISNWTKI